MERILVAVDFSDPSRTALRTALEMSRIFEAPLHVVHVIPSQICGPALAQRVSLLACGPAEAESRLVDLVLSESKGATEDLARVDYKALEGNESTEILREAEAWRASLLVIGSHGRTGLAGQFLGSISSRLLSRAPMSVLIIPEGTSKALPERILATVDGDRIGSHVIQRASRWAKAMGAELAILHVLPDILETGAGRLSRDAQESAEWQAVIKRAESEVRSALDVALHDDPKPQLHYRVGRPYVEICAEAREGGHDLIIVGYEHKQFALDLGNTAGRVAHSAPCPVLVLRAEMERSVSVMEPSAKL